MKISCGFFIINSNKEVLLQRTWYNQNNYEIPKGQLEPNETEFDCAIRETNEEIGLNLMDTKTIPTSNVNRFWEYNYISYQSKTRKKLKPYVLELNYDGYDLMCVGGENRNVSWIPLSDMINGINTCHHTQLEVFKKINEDLMFYYQ